MLGYALKPCSNRSDPYSILLEESGSGKTAPWMTALIEPRQRRNDGPASSHTHAQVTSIVFTTITTLKHGYGKISPLRRRMGVRIQYRGLNNYLYSFGGPFL